MTTNEPLISKSDLQAIHKGNQLNRRVLQSGIRDLVHSVHEGNQQSAEQIKEVTDKWKS